MEDLEDLFAEMQYNIHMNLTDWYSESTMLHHRVQAQLHICTPKPAAPRDISQMEVLQLYNAFADEIKE